jgi:c-di-GMP-binding flagellar brake protein YcgR
MRGRRRHIRIQTLQPILYYEAIRPRPKTGSTINLSLGGVCIETSYPLFKGEILDIAIALESRVITCSGRVLHVHGLKRKRFRAGVCFEKISEENRRLLEQYLSATTERQRIHR